MTKRLVTCIGALSLTLLLNNTLEAVDPGFHKSNWRKATALVATMLVRARGAGGAISMFINESVGLAARSSELDQSGLSISTGGDGVWRDLYNDMATGNTKLNYHMSWSLSGDGELSTEYGPATTYNAPDYSADSDVRDVTLTVTVDEVDRTGGDGIQGQ